MNFEKGHLYHIYNQGNNRQPIFFNRENYLFFLEKIKKHILPYADILAWCLMPNHFHLMVHVNETELPENSPSATSSRARTIYDTKTMNSGTQSGDPTKNKPIKLQSLQHSIGVMLASYTRAINKQNNWSGSLFRSETKAICITQNDKITRPWFTSQGITQINVIIPEKQYPNICFNYINFNPLKDSLVKHIKDWEFCSYNEIMGESENKIIHSKKIEEFGLELIGNQSGQSGRDSKPHSD